MGMRAAALFPALTLAAGLASGSAAFAEAPADPDAVSRGEYVFHAAGCFGCHTDVKNKGPALAGGRALKTPFGTFFAPNITPDREHGIGNWNLGDFTRAVREGLAPDGRPYYPAFPYTSFTGMSDRDIADLWAYLRSVQPVARANRTHRLDFPFNLRGLMWFWRGLFFDSARFDAGRPPPGIDDADAWRRGAYLVRAMTHCGECHTPRGLLGERKPNLELAGNAAGAEGDGAPNVTPHEGNGIGDWTEGDVVTYLKIGMDPEGDFAGSAMAEVIEHSTGRLTDADRRAVARFVRSLPPIDRKISRKAK